MRVIAAAVLIALACHPPPDDVEDSFQWNLAVAELREALLATCTAGEHIVAVGGVPGRGVAFEWDGKRWVEAALPAGTDLLWWCWVDEEGEGWAVGENTTIVQRLSDGTWRADATAVAFPRQGTHLFGIWQDGLPFAVGGAFTPTGEPSVLMLGAADFWEPFDLDGISDEVLFKIWGAGRTLWAVGGGGTIVRIDRGSTSTTASAVASPVDDKLIAVWGDDAEAYAVGGDGRGVVLRYDGSAWSEFATAPEELSAVWTAPGRPLYVGGARGYLARIDRRTGFVRAAVPYPDIDIHALTGTADGTILATGRDLLSGGEPRWRGAVLTHNGARAGDVERLPTIDAGVEPDAGEQVDAGMGPGPGEPCNLSGSPLCAPGLECWQLLESDVALCTQPCEHELDCRPAYGDDACCALPGFQTLETVCIPGQYVECR